MEKKGIIVFDGEKCGVYLASHWNVMCVRVCAYVCMYVWMDEGMYV